MNLYEHTIIARQDVSANDLKKIEEKKATAWRGLRSPEAFALDLKSNPFDQTRESMPTLSMKHSYSL